MQQYEKGAEDVKAAFQEISEKAPELDKERGDLEKSDESPDIENLSCYPHESDVEESEEELQVHDSLPKRTNVSETIKKNEKYYENIRELNEEQKHIFWYMHDWCQKKKIHPIHHLELALLGVQELANPKS